jgi:hypothetical protein
VSKISTIPATYRQIRPDHFEVFRHGKRIGSLSQIPANADRAAGRWQFWEAGKAPTPAFRTIEEAKDAIA